MSDDEYYSDSVSENNDSDNEEIPVSNKISLLKPSVNIKTYDTDYYDQDDSEEDNDANDVDDEDDDEEDKENEEENEEEEEGYKKTGGSGEIIDDTDDDSSVELNEEDEDNINKPLTKNNKINKSQFIVEEDDDDDDEYDEYYLQKFSNEIITNYVSEFHPECLNHNYEEIASLSTIVKNSNGIIIDPLHKTIPYLTKYEKARILGQRAKQIETGSNPFVKVPENIVDSYIIAELELREKKIPFIIRRPIPGGSCEYWKLKDLEIIDF